MRAWRTGARGRLLVGLVFVTTSAAGCGLAGDLQDSGAAAQVIPAAQAGLPISMAMTAPAAALVDLAPEHKTRRAAEASCGAGPSSGRSSSYGWPVKPFHRQHPVRGYFGDTRIGPDPDGTIHRTFHFGVDVSAPDGTAVYATVSGVVAANGLHPDVVRVLRGGGAELSYWHIAPAVRPGQRVVAYRTLIGRIEPGWGHVHLSEMHGGAYVNPLLGPAAWGPTSTERVRRPSRSASSERGSRRRLAPCAASSIWWSAPSILLRCRLLLRGRTCRSRRR